MELSVNCLQNRQKKIAGNRERTGPCNTSQNPATGGERNLIMARTRSKEHPMPPEGCWIKYQLDLRNIKLEDVAQKAHRSVSSVSRVVCGIKKSEKVESALAEMLGYPSYKHLWAAAFINSRGGAA
jgi:hypothetical protein